MHIYKPQCLLRRYDKDQGKKGAGQKDDCEKQNKSEKKAGIKRKSIFRGVETRFIVKINSHDLLEGMKPKFGSTRLMYSAINYRKSQQLQTALCYT